MWSALGEHAALQISQSQPDSWVTTCLPCSRSFSPSLFFFTAVFKLFVYKEASKTTELKASGSRHCASPGVWPWAPPVSLVPGSLRAEVGKEGVMAKVLSGSERLRPVTVLCTGERGSCCQLNLALSVCTSHKGQSDSVRGDARHVSQEAVA